MDTGEGNEKEEGRKPKRGGKEETRYRAGPDLEAVEGDIPDSCRHAWIILGPLLARVFLLPLPRQKTAPLIEINLPSDCTLRQYGKSGGRCVNFLRDFCHACPLMIFLSFFFQKKSLTSKSNVSRLPLMPARNCGPN